MPATRITLQWLLPLAFLCFAGCGSNDDDSASVPSPFTPPLNTVVVTEGSLAGFDYVVVEDRALDLRVAFRSSVDGVPVKLFPTTSSQAGALLDDDGESVYDVFGVGIAGENRGLRLDPLPYGTAFWLVYAGMYPGVNLVGRPGIPTDTLRLRYVPEYDIPVNSLFSGSGFGVIGTIDEPAFTAVNLRNEPDRLHVLDDDEIVAVRIGGDLRIYPLPVLTIFEIVNDVVGGVPIAVTYSPLSGSTRVWERPAAETKFGVTGMLWNSSMLMFAKENPASRYHQISGRGVRGNARGTYLRPVSYARMTYTNWKNVAREYEVLLPAGNVDLDQARRMDARIRGLMPHGYPVDFVDPRLPEKAKVLGVSLSGEGVVYPLD